MILIFIFAAMIVIGTVLGKYASWGSDLGFLAFLLTTIGCILLVLCLITIPLNHMEVESNIARYEAIKQTAATARESGDGYEAAAFRMKVAYVNAEIASAKYYNNTVFDIWFPDAVEDLQPIQ